MSAPSGGASKRNALGVCVTYLMKHQRVLILRAARVVVVWKIRNRAETGKKCILRVCLDGLVHVRPGNGFIGRRAVVKARNRLILASLEKNTILWSQAVLVRRGTVPLSRKPHPALRSVLRQTS